MKRQELMAERSGAEQNEELRVALLQKLNWIEEKRYKRGNYKRTKPPLLLIRLFALIIH